MTSIRHTTSGAIDTGYYMQRAHCLRARVVRKLWRRSAAAVAGALRRTVTGRWRMRGIRRWLRCET